MSFAVIYPETARHLVRFGALYYRWRIFVRNKFLMVDVLKDEVSFRELGIRIAVVDHAPSVQRITGLIL